MSNMFMFFWQPAQSYQTIDSLQVRVQLKLTVVCDVRVRSNCVLPYMSSQKFQVRMSPVVFAFQASPVHPD